ncbi:MAG TPA: hypothetical protein VK648_01630 [Gemmatimonadaceae bacterium]|nr:hypothetical protein [Gemmatimonadaceae bacterium]
MTSRRGFALAAALLAIMLIAALVAGVFLAAAEETRIGSASSAKEAALWAAESAIELTMRGWPSFAQDSLAVSGVRSLTIDAFGTPVSVSVTRLDSTLFAIVAEARLVSSRSAATRRIGVIARVHLAPDHSITIDRVPERWWSELF